MYICKQVPNFTVDSWCYGKKGRKLGNREELAVRDF